MVVHEMSVADNDARVRFFEPQDLGPRDWGREILVGHAPGLYTGKILEMRAGAKGGLQKHHFKDECGYVVKGTLILRYDDGDGELRERTLQAGDCVHIPPGAIHQEEAVTDCVIFEVSTPHFNDRVRVESEYGLDPGGGLPSTGPDDVEVR